MAASGEAQGLQDRKGQEQRQGAGQRSGDGGKALAPRPEANSRAAALRQPAGEARRRGSRSRAVIPDMLLPQDFKPRQEPATPHSLRPAPATGGVRRLIGRGTRCCVLIGYTSPVLFRACSGLHFVSIGSRRLVQDGVVIRDSLVGCLIRASFLPGEGRRLGG